MFSQTNKSLVLPNESPDRSINQIREAIDSLVLKKWFLESAIACLEHEEVVPESFKQDTLVLVDSLEKESQKYDSLINKEHQIQYKQSLELEQLRLSTKDLIGKMRQEPQDRFQKLRAIEKSLERVQKEKQKLLENRSKLPWFQESEMMKQEANGLHKQKEVLLSKLKLLNHMPKLPN